MNVVEAAGLSKRFGKTEAVRHLDLAVPAGSVFGLLGPNGSGKSTTLGLLLGAIHPDRGRVAWFGGAPPQSVRARVGVLLESPAFYPHLSAETNLRVVAGIRGCPTSRIRTVLDQVGLEHRATSSVQTYSLGMRQRLGLAAALLADPDVLVLDEPTNGLDPPGIADVRRLIGAIQAEGKSVIVASHLLDEVERVCTHVAILRDGRLLAAGDIPDLLGHENRVLLGSHDLTALENALAGLAFVRSVTPANGRLDVLLDDTVDPAELNRLLCARGIALSNLETRSRRLERVFLDLVNRDEPVD